MTGDAPTQQDDVLNDAERMALYRQGIDHFNVCDFFEAHEVWEALWTEYRGSSRKFFQGLIQAAVALHHFGNGNLRGALKVYRTSCGYLQAYRPVHLGLDVEHFLSSMDRCFQDVPEGAVSGVEIDPERIPEIWLTVGVNREQSS